MIDKLYPKKQKTSNSKCPQCGCEISIHSSFESALSGQFDNPNEGSWSYTSFSPVRKADLLTDVCVPGAQAIVTSLLLFPLAWGSVVFFGYDWKCAFPISAIVMMGAWIKGVNRLEMERGENRQFSYEPNEAEYVGQGERAQGERLSFEVISKDDDFKAAMKIVDLPQGVAASEFVQFCRDILAGKSLARREWIGDGKQFSRDQYDDLSQAMVSSGLVMKVAGKGRMLTPGGRRAIARMIRQA